VSLSPGDRLGHIEVLSRLGAGGMGVVYHARDTRLGRDVALKTLPAAKAFDGDGRALLAREARLLASLSHPNVASLYGIEDLPSAPVLVMELVPGVTLASRLLRGPLPVREALEVARQIAAGLEAAHRCGIIHRDLKPSNVKISDDGQVKVLDFGLASVVARSTDGDPQRAETASHGDSAIAGTTGYMSPEQARGEDLDERTDMWSFGCVLYESLAGRPAFARGTSAETVAALLEHEPDWSALPSTTPHLVRAQLRLLLEKDRTRRLQSIADARRQIEDVLAGSVPPPPARWRPHRWLLAAAAVAGTAYLLVPRRHAAPRGVTRFTITMPAGAWVSVEPNAASSVDIAPDGSRIAYIEGTQGRTRIVVRDRSRLESSPVPGTESTNTGNPFFSPDGRWLGFEAQGALKKAPLDGGQPVSLCEAPEVRGATWSPSGTIVFAPRSAGGLQRVAAAGGPCEALTTPDAGRREKSHRFPHALPDGEHVLFTAVSTDTASHDDSRIEVVSLRTGERRVVLEAGRAARYLPTGHLVFGRQDALMAVPFDARALRASGSPVPVVRGVFSSASSGEVHFATANDGSLAYVPGGSWSAGARLAWADRRGRIETSAEAPRPMFSVALSPDGQRAAFTLAQANDQIWIHDLARGAWTRLTFEWDSELPTWSHDGSQIVFSSSTRAEPHVLNLFRMPADGSGAPERLTRAGQSQTFPASSRDGRLLVFTQVSPPFTTGDDVWLLRVDERKVEALLSEPFNETMPRLSPDGRWLAYVSDETGREEVFVRPFPALRPKWMVSSAGGTEPRWAPSGREIFYRDGARLMAVALTTAPAFSAERARPLFEAPFWVYDVTPDGQRFLIVQGIDDTAPAAVHVVLNWAEELHAARGGER
jgi:serine/threonine-protein kinase